MPVLFARDADLPRLRDILLCRLLFMSIIICRAMLIFTRVLFTLLMLIWRVAATILHAIYCWYAEARRYLLCRLFFCPRWRFFFFHYAPRALIYVWYLYIFAVLSRCSTMFFATLFRWFRAVTRHAFHIVTALCYFAKIYYLMSLFEPDILLMPCCFWVLHYSSFTFTIDADAFMLLSSDTPFPICPLIITLCSYAMLSPCSVRCLHITLWYTISVISCCLWCLFAMLMRCRFCYSAHIYV